LSSRPLLSAAFFRGEESTAHFVSLHKKYKTSTQQWTLLTARLCSARVFFFGTLPTVHCNNCNDGRQHQDTDEYRVIVDFPIYVF
jgi:hypothetical protein